MKTRKVLDLFLRIGWLGLCVAVLANAIHHYQGKSDWKMEEGLGIDMIVLGFPASILVAIAFMMIGFVANGFGTGLPSPSRNEMIGTWLIFTAAGYFQWFVVLPSYVRKWRNNDIGT